MIADIWTAVRNATATTTNPMQWFVDWVRGGQESDSGVVINHVSALGYPPVYQAVRMIAGDISRLPLNVYMRRDDDGREPDYEHPAWWPLNEQANDYMTANVLRETLQCHALLTGNGYAKIDRDGAGRVVQLMPLGPLETEPKVTDTGRLYYETRINGEEKEYSPDEILHLKGLGFDGIRGYSVLTLARNAFGLGLAEEKHGNRHFKNDARPTVILKHPQNLSPEKANQLILQWMEKQSGDNFGRPALAAGGLDIQVVPINNSDAQWLEARKFQRVEIALLFGVPPHRLGADTNTSYSSIIAEETRYVTDTLGPWLHKWEQEAGAKLLTNKQRRSRSHYIEHNSAALMKGDITTRYEAYQIGIQNMWLSPNEVRKRENMNPREGGDEFVNPYTTSSTNPAQDDQPDDGTQDDSAGNNAMANAHRQLFLDRVKKLMQAEASQMCRNAKSPDCFLDRLDKFYATWHTRVEEAITPIIRCLEIVETTSYDPAAIAKQMAEQSQRSLLQIAGYSHEDNLLENVTTAVEQWPTTRPIEIFTTLGDFRNGQ